MARCNTHHQYGSRLPHKEHYTPDAKCEAVELFACTQYFSSPYAIKGHPEHMLGCIR